MITIIDDLPPETLAMLQALYSRSTKGVKEHLKKVNEQGSNEFMKSYYVGYGHKSIGDCGVTTLFFEGISLLAAKAIQDTPLYSGQETSTRYIDFTQQPIVNSSDDPRSDTIMENWIAFYSEAQEPLIEYLKEQFPFNPDTGSNSVWEKAIKARSFDIMRGFLPCGVTTNVSWTTNLRQAYDHLLKLSNHNLLEVSRLADHALAMLKENYPSSFGHVEKQEVLDYYNKWNYFFNYSDNYRDDISICGNEISSSVPNLDIMESNYKWFAKERPKGALLPQCFATLGAFRLNFQLDFGSYRDIQRHRNSICRPPIVDWRNGFNQWYLDQLPTKLRERAEFLIDNQFNAIGSLGLSLIDSQYLVPLGTNVNVEMLMSLPQLVYIIELRSMTTVHPTLRKVVLEWAKFLREHYPSVSLYEDTSEDSFCITRGKQDIIDLSEVGL